MTELDKSPLNYKINDADSLRRYSFNRAPTAADYKNFRIGDEWLNNTSNDWYKLSSKTATSGTWIIIGGTGLVTETLTGDAGGPINPDILNNITLDGNTNGMQITGVPATNTLEFLNLRNTTSYVVDATAGATEYQTIQAAIDAANAAGDAAEIYIRPAIYTEDLTFYRTTYLRSIGTGAAIVGMHIPPATGNVVIDGFTLTSPTSIFDDAVAGIGILNIQNCFTAVANGYTYNLPNWTGNLLIDNCGSLDANNGIVNNTAGATIFFINSDMGAGPNVFTANGTVRLDQFLVRCPVNITGAGTNLFFLVEFLDTVTLGGTQTPTMSWVKFNTGVNQSLIYTSANPLILSDGIVNSVHATPIDGNGTIVFGSVVFENSAAIAGTITKTVITREETGPIHIGTGTTNANVQLDIVETAVAGNVMGLMSNEDNSDIGSNSLWEIETGGDSGGDPYVKFNVLGTTYYSLGIDNSDSDILKITDGLSPSNGNELWKMTTAGERTMPLQPAFSAYLPSTVLNATGGGTGFTIGSGTALTEVFDQNSDFVTTGTFTAPITGRYNLGASIACQLLGAANSKGFIVILTSNRNYYSGQVNWGAIRDLTDGVTGLYLSALADMDAGDTATFLVQIFNGGGDTVSVFAGGTLGQTYVYGSLIV